MFDGYFDNPEATAAAFTEDGFFRTGDLAARRRRRIPLDRRSRQGRDSHRWRDRVAVRSRGRRAHHPALADVAVVGIPMRSGARSCARCSWCRDGAEAPTLATLRRVHRADAGALQAAAARRGRRRVAPHARHESVQRRLLIERLSQGLTFWAGIENE